MKRLLIYLPLVITILAVIVLFAYGPIAQLPHYHAFADQSFLLGIPHTADVLSNLGFAAVAIWGKWQLWPMRTHAALQAGRYGYALFLVGLLCTAVGSSFYHCAPDNVRLVWDRLPIAWVCAGLLIAVRAETQNKFDSKLYATSIGLLATASVAWWYLTDQRGTGDLRPYLLLQGLPLVLIPLWQFNYSSPVRDRMAFGMALLFYVFAKISELNDHQIQSALGLMSGHTLKHLLATVAAWILVARLVERTRHKLN